MIYFCANGLNRNIFGTLSVERLYDLDVFFINVIFDYMKYDVRLYLKVMFCLMFFSDQSLFNVFKNNNKITIAEIVQNTHIILVYTIK